MDDRNLLQEYAQSGSDAAFETLVRRHVNLVYAAALRQARDAHLAQDITQAVFILLARKAGSLKSSVVLSGWLYRTASHVASRAIRDRMRRKNREEEASQMMANETADELWTKLAPHLDSAIGSLGDSDRDAVVLRFLQQRSFREVAGALGVSEDAAKKRVTRALDKLRGNLVARGIAVTGVTLLTALQASAASVIAPASVTANAIGTSTAVAASGSAAALAAAVARQWFVTRLKWAVGLVGSIAVVVLLFTQSASSNRDPSPFAADQTSIESARTPAASPEVVAAKSQPPPRQMRLRVISSVDDSPLTNAVARVALYGPHPDPTLAADSNGVLTIPVPERGFSGMAVWVTAPTFVPKAVSWKRSDDSSLPADYVLKLSPGLTASGTVVDEAGNPVSGATVRFDSEGIQPTTRDYADYRYPPFVPTTDVAGRWFADFLKASPLAHGYVEHPDFAETEFSYVLPETGASNLTFTIRKGAGLSGFVTDANRSPIPDANVEISWQFSFRKAIKITTDDRGWFNLPHVTPGKFRVAASASGFRPTEQWVELPETGLTVTNVLTATKVAGAGVLVGQVVDESGQPLVDVNLRLADGQPALDGVSWSTATDVAGRFAWKAAPASSVRVRFSAAEREALDLDLATDGNAHTVTMKPAEVARWHCRVTERASGKPLSRFTVLQGTRDLGFLNGLDHVELVGDGVNGGATFPWDAEKWKPAPQRSRTIWVVRIEAEGYEPETVMVTNAPQPGMEITAALSDAAQLEGIVQTPSGLPASGAEVALVGGPFHYTLPSADNIKQPDYYRPEYTTTTRPNGEFKLALRKQATHLLVVHEQGWALVPFQRRAARIRLQPWGRVEGVLHLGGQLGANQTVALRSPDAAGKGILAHQRTQTDSAGRFQFAKVLPGQLQVVRQLSASGEYAAAQIQAVTVTAGETATVTLGGKGIEVRGRLKLESPRAGVQFDLGPQTLQPAQSPNDYFQSIGFVCQPDGSFVAQDVNPGTYTLKLRAYSPKKKSETTAYNYTILAEHQVNVVVPENQSEPLDLGDIVVPIP